jgi:uncharacterized protein YndB with AHSA1/START domain
VRKPAATRSTIVEREMPHPPDKIWRALTQGALIEEWLMKNDFQPVLGHRFNFRAAAMPHWNGVTDCEVLFVEPNERLSYSWNASGEEAATGLKTVITWTLTRTKGGTLVRMQQSGFRPEEEANYQGASYAGSGSSAGWSESSRRWTEEARFEKTPLPPRQKEHIMNIVTVGGRIWRVAWGWIRCGTSAGGSSRGNRAIPPARCRGHATGRPCSARRSMARMGRRWHGRSSTRRLPATW